MIKFTTISRQETERAGKKLGECLGEKFRKEELLEGMTILLKGELGAGKTTYIRGVIRAVIPGERVTSPSYTLINEYTSSLLSFVHADLYRLQQQEEAEHIGLFEYPHRRSVLLVEWPERISIDWGNYLEIEINRGRQERKRILKIRAAGKREKNLLEELNGIYECGRD
ncbi:tRNA (adenosine(37)-N6)-threonylcarbamoyltransferase complex ATPase subunit type 1 TsaE [Halarsenatibacter silvermanii]|uniref:tRNA threonylcarbamoyladenosine biosynthesis protein TsaE n=1 Tax=Halarsenatibacter silvermanii TaxID=321763 RepID=A0A1G9NFQ6_9FIRM|nr:tRNA (adenosine(37)-N6)-threonylcarbamoyltransferase complex ATPase subunit type 1 TsaE [Halarsenatibacter silvermanii]SDL84867.1 Threonylcarbamoyl adenosine biosynthesis protein TsaE [Halarsenatibacter silvermanii]